MMNAKLNELLGIDDTEKVHTQADLIDACSKLMDREREGQTVEWGYRRVGEPDELIRRVSDGDHAIRAGSEPGFETVYRLVKPWTVD